MSEIQPSEKQQGMQILYCTAPSTILKGMRGGVLKKMRARDEQETDLKKPLLTGSMRWEKMLPDTGSCDYGNSEL